MPLTNCSRCRYLDRHPNHNGDILCAVNPAYPQLWQRLKDLNSSSNSHVLERLAAQGIEPSETPWIEVDSSAIAAIAYDPHNSTLLIRFNRYQYFFFCPLPSAIFTMKTSLAAQLDSFTPNISSTAEELHQLIVNLKQTLTDLETNYIKQLAIEQGLWDFYPTPPILVRQMLELAAINSHHRVLEPSAGTGDICFQLRTSGVKHIDCFEKHPLLQKALKLQGYNLIGDDFLGSTPQPLYERIIANPPFSRNGVAHHTQHAYQYLKSRGILVTLAHHYQLKPSSNDLRFFSWLKQVKARFLNCHQAMSNSDRPTNTPLQLILIEKL